MSDSSSTLYTPAMLLLLFSGSPRQQRVGESSCKMGIIQQRQVCAPNCIGAGGTPGNTAFPNTGVVWGRTWDRSQQDLGWEVLKHSGDSGKCSPHDDTHVCKSTPLEVSCRGCLLSLARFFSLSLYNMQRQWNSIYLSKASFFLLSF